MEQKGTALKPKWIRDALADYQAARVQAESQQAARAEQEAARLAGELSKLVMQLTHKQCSPSPDGTEAELDGITFRISKPEGSYSYCLRIVRPCPQPGCKNRLYSQPIRDAEDLGAALANFEGFRESHEHYFEDESEDQQPEAPLPAWHSLAIEAAQAQAAQRAAEAAQREAEEGQEIQRRLAAMGIQAEMKASPFKLGAVTFRLLKGYGLPTLAILGTCPKCGKPAASKALYSLADIGEQLQGFTPCYDSEFGNMHFCNQEDNSPSARLLAALADFMDEHHSHE